MREVLDRLSPMLGFRVRVTERGGVNFGLPPVKQKPVEWLRVWEA